MQISAELSLYPLAEDYKPIIRDYITRLQQFPELEVHCNRMSTQIFGEYRPVMEAITQVTEHFFELDPTMVLTAKILSSDRRP